MSIQYSSIEQLFYVLLLPSKILHLLLLVGEHFHFKTCAKMSFKVLWGITFHHLAIFQDTDPCPHEISLFDVLSRYQD